VPNLNDPMDLLYDEDDEKVDPQKGTRNPQLDIADFFAAGGAPATPETEAEDSVPFDPVDLLGIIDPDDLDFDDEEDDDYDDEEEYEDEEEELWPF